MKNRHISKLVGLLLLLLPLFVWQRIPMSMNNDVSAKDIDPYASSQISSDGHLSALPILDKSLSVAATSQLFLPSILKNYIPPNPLWRFGVTEVRNRLTSYDSNDITAMRFGWFMNYRVENPTNPYNMEFVQVIRVKQWKYAVDGTPTLCRTGPYYLQNPSYSYSVTPSVSQIQTIALANPGMTWLLGNEMDALDWTTSTGFCSGQDEMLPELYAQAYHDIYSAIKSVDPTAQVAIGGMIEFTDLRSQYLDRIWAEYIRLYEHPMPVDIWNIHLYVLQEKSCDAYPTDCWGAHIPPGFTQPTGELTTIFDTLDFPKAWAQIISLRNWMKDHGQQNKPLIITEYGALFPAYVACDTYPDTTGCPFTPEKVRDSFMYPSFDAFLTQTDATIGFPADGNRLVQRWNWFSNDYDLGKCDTDGLYIEYFGGSLFNSGLGPEVLPVTCSFPAKGIATLGTYWKQYVQNLPAGSLKPYGP